MLRLLDLVQETSWWDNLATWLTTELATRPWTVELSQILVERSDLEGLYGFVELYAKLLHLYTGHRPDVQKQPLSGAIVSYNAGGALQVGEVVGVHLLNGGKPGGLLLRGGLEVSSCQVLDTTDLDIVEKLATEPAPQRSRLSSLLGLAIHNACRQPLEQILAAVNKGFAEIGDSITNPATCRHAWAALEVQTAAALSDLDARSRAVARGTLLTLTEEPAFEPRPVPTSLNGVSSAASTAASVRPPAFPLQPFDIANMQHQQAQQQRQVPQPTGQPQARTSGPPSGSASRANLPAHLQPRSARQQPPPGQSQALQGQQATGYAPHATTTPDQARATLVTGSGFAAHEFAPSTAGYTMPGPYTHGIGTSGAIPGHGHVHGVSPVAQQAAGWYHGVPAQQQQHVHRQQPQVPAQAYVPHVEAQQQQQSAPLQRQVEQQYGHNNQQYLPSQQLDTQPQSHQYYQAPPYATAQAQPPQHSQHPYHAHTAVVDGGAHVPPGLASSGQGPSASAASQPSEAAVRLPPVQPTPLQPAPVGAATAPAAFVQLVPLSEGIQVDQQGNLRLLKSMSAPGGEAQPGAGAGAPTTAPPAMHTAGSVHAAAVQPRQPHPELAPSYCGGEPERTTMGSAPATQPHQAPVQSHAYGTQPDGVAAAWEQIPSRDGGWQGYGNPAQRERFDGGGRPAYSPGDGYQPQAAGRDYATSAQPSNGLAPAAEPSSTDAGGYRASEPGPVQTERPRTKAAAAGAEDGAEASGRSAQTSPEAAGRQAPRQQPYPQPAAAGASAAPVGATSPPAKPPLPLTEAIRRARTVEDTVRKTIADKELVAVLAPSLLPTLKERMEDLAKAIANAKAGDASATAAAAAAAAAAGSAAADGKENETHPGPLPPRNLAFLLEKSIRMTWPLETTEHQLLRTVAEVLLLQTDPNRVASVNVEEVRLQPYQQVGALLCNVPEVADKAAVLRAESGGTSTFVLLRQHGRMFEVREHVRETSRQWLVRLRVASLPSYTELLSALRTAIDTVLPPPKQQQQQQQQSPQAAAVGGSQTGRNGGKGSGRAAADTGAAASVPLFGPGPESSAERQVLRCVATHLLGCKGTEHGMFADTLPAAAALLPPRLAKQYNTNDLRELKSLLKGHPLFRSFLGPQRLELVCLHINTALELRHRAGLVQAESQPQQQQARKRRFGDASAAGENAGGEKDELEQWWQVQRSRSKRFKTA